MSFHINTSDNLFFRLILPLLLILFLLTPFLFLLISCKSVLEEGQTSLTVDWQKGYPEVITDSSLFVETSSLTLKDSEIALRFAVRGEGRANVALVSANLSFDVTRDNFYSIPALYRDSLALSERERVLVRSIGNLNRESEYLLYAYLEENSSSWREQLIRLTPTPLDWGQFSPRIEFNGDELELSLRRARTGSLYWVLFLLPVDSIPTGLQVREIEIGFDGDEIPMEIEWERGDPLAKWKSFPLGWSRKEVSDALDTLGVVKKDLPLSVVLFFEQGRTKSSLFWLEFNL